MQTSLGRGPLIRRLPYRTILYFLCFLSYNRTDLWRICRNRSFKTPSWHPANAAACVSLWKTYLQEGAERFSTLGHESSSATQHIHFRAGHHHSHQRVALCPHALKRKQPRTADYKAFGAITDRHRACTHPPPGTCWELMSLGPLHGSICFSAFMPPGTKPLLPKQPLLKETVP